MHVLKPVTMRICDDLVIRYINSQSHLGICVLTLNAKTDKIKAFLV